MTTYQCDTCHGEAPGAAAGTSFLVLPNGRTDHFCSQACLRAHVNREPLRESGRLWYGIVFALGAAFEAFIMHILKLNP